MDDTWKQVSLMMRVRMLEVLIKHRDKTLTPDLIGEVTQQSISIFKELVDRYDK